MKLKTDVLIIGGGISGLSVAIELAELDRNLDLLLLTKESLTDCNTYYAQGGIACVWDKKDSFEKHVQDTLRVGDGLCNEQVVRNVVSQAPERVKELIDLGVDFTRNEEGEYDLTKEGGHSERRILHVNDITGQNVENSLIRKVKKYDNINIKENWCAINLYAKNLHCYGAYIFEKESERIHNIAAKVTILATGGAGKIYFYGG